MIRKLGRSGSTPSPIPEKGQPIAAASPPPNGSTDAGPSGNLSSQWDPAPGSTAPPAEASGDLPSFNDPVMGRAPRKQLIPEAAQPGLSQQLQNPNFFGELIPVPFSAKPTAAPSGKTFRDRLEKNDEGFLSGRNGRLQAARLIPRALRTDGDFRYALGRETYRAWTRADAHLQAIPRGQLAQQLTVERLGEVQALADVPGEAPTSERFERAVRQLVLRQSHSPGSLRRFEPLPLSTRSLTIPLRAQLEQRGMRRSATGYLFFPRHDEVGTKLEAVLAQTRAQLRDPASDPFVVAARFVLGMAAVRPFGAANGRTARLVGDRILEEYGHAPPVRQSFEDLNLGEEALVAELRAGSWRMQEAIEPVSDSARLRTASLLFELFEHPPLAWAEDPAPVLRVGGMPFALGKDGFVCDEAGRPYLLDAGTLVPLGQWTYYLLMRRAATAVEGRSQLEALTASTRAAFAHWRQDPALASKVTVASDLAAIDDDNAFRVRVPFRNNEPYLSFFDPRAASPERLFEVNAKRNMPVVPSTMLMSKYLQLDLELWHLGQALARADDGPGSEQVRGYRQSLFELARSALLELQRGAGTPLTEARPHGFTRLAEVLQYEHSPLRFSSWAEALAADGDQSFTLWRGDTLLAETVGIHADSVVGHPDARSLEAGRSARHGTSDPYTRLQKVSLASGGTGYQSYTSDLSLLIFGFADFTNRFPVALEALPALLRKWVEARLRSHPTTGVTQPAQLLRWAFQSETPVPAGHLEVTGLQPEVVMTALTLTRNHKAPILTPEQQQVFEERLRAAARKSVDSRSDRTFVEVEDLIGDAGSAELAEVLDPLRFLVELKQDPETGAVTLEVHQRAYGIRVDKRWAIPGIDAVGGGMESEQEVHVARSQLPNRVFGRWTSAELQSPAKQDR